MIKKRWVVVGLDGSGKGEICDYIEAEKKIRSKSSELIYRKNTIQVPAAYLENTWMNNIIIMLAQNQGKANIFLLDGRSLDSMYSPSFAKAFTKSSLGIVTNSENMSIEKRQKALDLIEKIGCEKNIFLSFQTNEGFDQLDSWLEKTK